MPIASGSEFWDFFAGWDAPRKNYSEQEEEGGSRRPSGSPEPSPEPTPAPTFETWVEAYLGPRCTEAGGWTAQLCFSEYLGADRWLFLGFAPIQLCSGWAVVLLPAVVICLLFLLRLVFSCRRTPLREARRLRRDLLESGDRETALRGLLAESEGLLEECQKELAGSREETREERQSLKEEVNGLRHTLRERARAEGAARGEVAKLQDRVEELEEQLQDGARTPEVILPLVEERKE